MAQIDGEEEIRHLSAWDSCGGVWLEKENLAQDIAFLKEPQNDNKMACYFGTC